MSAWAWAWTRLDHRHAGSLLAIIADAAFVSMDGTVQYLEEGVGLSMGQITFDRMAGTLLLALVYLTISSPSTIPETWRHPQRTRIWIRSFNCALSLMLFYASLQYIPLSEAIVTYHLRPFPTALLCYAALGETFTTVQLWGSLISFAAVLLVVQPAFLFPFSSSSPSNSAALHRPLGFLLVALSTLSNAWDILLVRQIGPDVDVLLFLTVYTAGGLIMSVLWMIGTASPLVIDLPARAWVGSAGIVVAGILAQIAVVLALQRETGAHVAVLGYLQIVMAIIIQIVFLGKMPGGLALVGTGVIIAAGVWSARQIYGADKNTELNREQSPLEDPEMQMGLLSAEEDVDDESANTPPATRNVSSGGAAATATMESESEV